MSPVAVAEAGLAHQAAQTGQWPSRADFSAAWAQASGRWRPGEAQHEQSRQGATGSRVSSRLEAKRKENAFSVSNNAFQTVKFKLSKIRKQAVTSGISSKRAAINAVKSEFTGRGFVRLSDADAGPFLAHFRKYKSSKSVIGTLDHKKRPTSMFGFSEIKNNGRGEDGTPDPMGTRLSSDDRSHGFPVSQLINPDHGNKQHFMVGENWLGNQGTTQGWNS
ncbi:hypothetical protein [Chitinimonas koreensis]|uniref:hypothetical protein n=1 Tax=Chitinimonas koreensis TaxID=356302 RepID=UPI0016540F62|nr:hypothetical protein [Chitinimonas koreensis]QNM95332.1 hypothetical protein H9L41_15840 [Chitinimonas koreensis]